MFKIFSILVLVALATDTVGQRFIHPTYRPPPKRPVIIRARRDIGNQEPLWLNQGDIPKAPASGDHPFLPNYIDDIKLNPNTRYPRSVDSPSARGHSKGSHSTSSGSRDTGATHPGYNRRNARDTRDQEPLWLNQGNIPKAPASGDHPFLPNYIDDIKLDPNTRYARSISSQSFMPRPTFPRPPTGPFSPFPKPGPPGRPFPIYA